MGFFKWLRQRPQPQQHSATVEYDDEGVTCRRPNGKVEAIKWSDLRAIVIQTTADGPGVDDVFWVLCGEHTGCVVPSETVGADKLVAHLQQLPGFDNGMVIKAMSCTDNREFLCWKIEPRQ